MNLVGVLCFLVLVYPSVEAAKPVIPKGDDSDGIHLEAGVKGILAMFDRFDLVALGERHGSKHDSDFRLALVADPDFHKKVDAIAVEFANPIHQDMLDAYVLQGKSFPEEQLRNIWRDAFFTAIWTSPIYRAFIEKVRERNLMLPEGKRVRIVAASRSMDWAKIRTPQELEPYMNRGTMMAQRVIDEILIKNQKGLLIFGSRHFWRGYRNKKSWGGMTASISVKYRDKLGVVVTVSGDQAKITAFAQRLGLDQPPYFIDLTKSVVGQWNGQEIFNDGRNDRFSKMADGLLFLGTEPDRIIKPPPAIKQDKAYMAELKRRMALHTQ